MPSRSLFPVLLGALALFACGKSTASRPAPSEEIEDGGASTTGGQRLQAVFLESGEISVLDHFYDIELALECDFVGVAPDAYRCLPIGAEAVRPADVVFGDRSCSERLVALYDSDDGCTRYRYAVWGAECGSEPSVFEIGEETSAGTRYRLLDGACVESNSGTDYLTNLYSATPVRLEAFQEARVVAGTESAGVVPLDLVSDDGARVRLGFRDALGGFACTLRGEEGDLRCLPSDSGVLGYVFADAACSVPAALQIGCAAGPGEMLFAWSPSENAYYRGGARLELA